MSVIKSTDADFKELINKNEKVVVKYYADWCGSCRLFSPKYNRLANDEKFAGIIFLDVNAEQNPEARKIAGVSNLPYFAIFKNGNLIEAATTSKEEYIIELLEKLN
jgi:thiol-disulfide isomerase/thioredoxin